MNSEIEIGDCSFGGTATNHCIFKYSFFLRHSGNPLMNRKYRHAVICRILTNFQSTELIPTCLYEFRESGKLFITGGGIMIRKISADAYFYIWKSRLFEFKC